MKPFSAVAGFVSGRVGRITATKVAPIFTFSPGKILVRLADELAGEARNGATFLVGVASMLLFVDRWVIFSRSPQSLPITTR